MAHTFGDGAVGDEVQETNPATGPALENRLPHSATPPFKFKWHPLRWQYFDTEDGEGEWLPLLGTVQYDLGVGNMDKTGGDSLARVELDRRGWKVLDWNCVPPGTPNGRYIRAFPCKDGTYHCTAWETPRHLGGRVLRSEVDEEGYREFLRWLVRERKVEPPSDAALELLTETQRAKLSQVKAKAGKNPARKPEADAEEARTLRMEKAPKVPKSPKTTPKAKAP